MIAGSCHCGAVSWEFGGIPDKLTSCNCSICRRIAALWAYGTLDNVTVTAAPDATVGYIQGDKLLAIHTCRSCGCSTHWAALAAENEKWRISVNMRMADPVDFADIRVRHFDGADSWTFLD